MSRWTYWALAVSIALVLCVEVVTYTFPLAFVPQFLDQKVRFSAHCRSIVMRMLILCLCSGLQRVSNFHGVWCFLLDGAADHVRVFPMERVASSPIRSKARTGMGTHVLARDCALCAGKRCEWSPE